MGLKELFASQLRAIEDHIKHHLQTRFAGADGLPELQPLFEAIGYGALDGGKRFRPLLTVLTAEALDQDIQTVLPFATAVEFVHSYSLIHDDLPSLDNDEFRRGRPTNHKVYGEALSLLAGDALLTEAFYVLATMEHPSADAIKECVRLVSEASGMRGMVGGQAADIAVLQKKMNADQNLLTTIHRLKTGALLCASVEGSAVLCDASEEQRRALVEYGAWLGFAFQLADDLLDYDPASPERSGYPSVLGVEKTQAELQSATTHSMQSLQPLDAKACAGLRALAQFNFDRLSF